MRPVAVGAAAGEAELHVMSASWGHALHPPDAFAEYEVGTRRVPIAALAAVLADAGGLAEDGARIVAKVNIEGEECSTVLGARRGVGRRRRGLRRDTSLGPLRRRRLAAPRPAGLTRAESSARSCSGCGEEDLLDPVDVPVPAEVALDRPRAASPSA